MLDLFNEVHDRDASDQFIREFPQMTFTQANKKYNDSSSSIAQKIQDSIAAKNKSDQLFMKVFDIAAKLPVDMHKKIAEQLLNNNAAAVEKFLDMPIGKALEWYAWCERASRGKMIYLPIFRQVLAENNLCHHAGLTTETMRVYESKIIVRDYRGKLMIVGILDEEGKIKQLKIDDVVKEETRNSPRRFYKLGEELAPLFDTIMSQLFILSKNEIMCFYPLFNDNTISYANLKHLVEIDKKINFLNSIDSSISYNCRASYSLENMCTLFRESLKTRALYVFPCFAIPLILARLPHIIEAQFCKKIVVESIVQKNAEKRVVNAVIESLGDKRLLQYCCTIKDETSYSYTDYFKYCLPILLPIPATGCFTGVEDWRYGYEWKRSILLGCICGVVPAFLLGVLSISPCVESNGALGISLGVSAVLSLVGSLGHQWEQLFKSQKNSVECKDIAQLIARRDIVIQ